MASGVGTGRRWVARWLAASGAGLLLVLAGCSSDGGSGSSGGSTGGAPAERGAQADDSATGGAAAGAPAPAAGMPAENGSEAGGDQSGRKTEQIRVDQPALIRTAEMTVRVDDVQAQARLARDFARAAGGAVAGDNRSGSGGRARADLVLKVQPSRLDGVLDQLGGLGEEQQRTSSTEDVTEAVADVESRVATMQASIARVRAILSRATRIGDVVAVEGELSRRVSELESLQARQRALAGRVGLATVTLHLLAKQAPAPAPAAERAGFLGGLSDGWTAFTRTVGWLLTALGAVLPFLIVLVPAALVWSWAVRRSRRPGAATTAAPPPAADSAG